MAFRDYNMEEDYQYAQVDKFLAKRNISNQQ